MVKINGKNKRLTHQKENKIVGGIVKTGVWNPFSTVLVKKSTMIDS